MFPFGHKCYACAQKERAYQELRAPFGAQVLSIALELFQGEILVVAM